MKSKRSSVWVVNPDVIGRYRRGQTIRQIATAYGVKWSTVHSALQRAGVEVGRQNKAGYRCWTAAEIQLMVDLRQQEKTFQQIADLLGRTKVSVNRQYQRLCNVRNPENYMSLRGVWYGEAA